MSIGPRDTRHTIVDNAYCTNYKHRQFMCFSYACHFVLYPSGRIQQYQSAVYSFLFDELTKITET